MARVDEATRRLLMWFVVPIWIGAGLADWLCHRRSDIEHTAGTRESVIHALMMSEAGVPATLGLLYEVNAGLLAITLAALGMHQATAAWDVSYADSRREVTPTEQHVHGLLEQVPVMATAFLTALHWDQARALIGAGGGRRRMRLEPKRQPLSPAYRAGLGGAVAGLVVVPYAEEVVRCRRAERGARRDRFATAQRPALMLYDAECPFCRWSAGMLLAWDRGGRIAPLALQEPEAAGLLRDLSPERRMQSWHLIAPSGERTSAGAAFAPLFELLPGARPLARLAGRFPGAANRLYYAVSERRDALVKLVPAPLERFAARCLRRREAQRRT